MKSMRSMYIFYVLWKICLKYRKDDNYPIGWKNFSYFHTFHTFFTILDK